MVLHWLGRDVGKISDFPPPEIIPMIHLNVVYLFAFSSLPLSYLL